MKKTYHISQDSSFSKLDEHLKKYPQLEKVIVYKNNHKEYIIDGLKRVGVLGYENTEKIFFDRLENAYEFMLSYKKLPDSSIYKIIVLLNKEMELERLSNLITKYFNISSRDIWKLLELEYSEELYDYFLKLNISIKELASYYVLSGGDLLSLMKFFMKFYPNKNNRRYFFEILFELSKIQNKSFEQLLNIDDINGILESKLQNNEKLKKLKDFLFNLRNPNLFAEIQNINNLKTKLKLPGIKIDLPIDIESSRVGISFNFTKLSDLEKKLSFLSKLNIDKNFLEILDFLKKR